jgi:hypothetical protein
MAWTHETEEGRLKVLVTRSDAVAGTMAMTEEQAVPRARLMKEQAVPRAWLTEEQAVPRARLTGTAEYSVPDAGITLLWYAIFRARLTGTGAERRYMERKGCERLWQAMPRVSMRRNRLTIRAVERAAKRQCKKDERQTEALLAKARDWSAHVFDPLSVESVTHQAALVKECLQRGARSREARARGCRGWSACRAGFARASAWRRS